MKREKQGFTLIELLVVVAIIGLLATLSLVALNSARARARDARRVADIKQIQTALELYYNDNNGYPASIASNIGTFMTIVPTAPTPNDGSCTSAQNSYSYTTATLNGIANNTYTLTYCLGAASGGLAAGSHTATPAGIAQ